MIYQGHEHQKMGCITYSQHGEDLAILNLFKLLGYEKFSWIDLGANHPERISNTKLFYEMGMCGVNIEANPFVSRLFIEQRPLDKNVFVGVGLKRSPAKLYMVDKGSPINTFCKSEVEKFEGLGQKYKEHFEVLMYTLDDLVEAYCDGQYPEFLNSDIEGMDYDVLRTADFEKSRPLIICAEVDHNDAHKFAQMMDLKGFIPYLRIQSNVIYVEYSAYEKLKLQIG